MKFFAFLLFSLFALRAYAVEARSSIAANVTANYVLVANFDLYPVKYNGLQIQNPLALEIECVSAPTSTTSLVRLAVGFTSITLDNANPTGQLYCRLVTAPGPATLIVNVWGLP